MAFRPIMCGVAAGVDGDVVGAIGLAAVAGGMPGVTATPATADAAAPFMKARVAAPRLQRDLPHGPGPIRARRPPVARSFSLTDDGAERSQEGTDLPFRPGACAS